jgi:hypothetical protein
MSGVMKWIFASQDECAERRRGGPLTEPVVFFSRCKPQGADALTIALEASRIFIGYPMPRVGADYQPRNLNACVVDPSCSDEEWEHARAQQPAIRPQYNQNRNLIKGIPLGSIAMIPRPDRGVIYCGKIVSGFELINNPSWYDQYMRLRRDQGHAEEDGPRPGMLRMSHNRGRSTIFVRSPFHESRHGFAGLFSADPLTVSSNLGREMTPIRTRPWWLF